MILSIIELRAEYQNDDSSEPADNPPPEAQNAGAIFPDEVSR